LSGGAFFLDALCENANIRSNAELKAATKNNKLGGKLPNGKQASRQRGRVHSQRKHVVVLICSAIDAAAGISSEFSTLRKSSNSRKNDPFV
jgi:hypothetical protein